LFHHWKGHSMYNKKIDVHTKEEKKTPNKMQLDTSKCSWKFLDPNFPNRALRVKMVLWVDFSTFSNLKASIWMKNYIMIQSRSPYMIVILNNKLLLMFLISSDVHVPFRKPLEERFYIEIMDFCISSLFSFILFSISSLFSFIIFSISFQAFSKDLIDPPLLQYYHPFH